MAKMDNRDKQNDATRKR